MTIIMSKTEPRISWIKRIPDHWSVIRVDRTVSQKSLPAFKNDEVVTVFINGIATLRKNVKSEGIKNAIIERGWLHVNKNDILISGMNAHLGAIGVSDSDGKCSPIYLVLRAKEGFDSKYLIHILREASLSGFIRSVLQTIRYNSADIKFYDLKRINIPKPPLQEQQAIVRFLDQKLAKIDEYISKKERMIELLKEQKISLINEAVTQGLDPDVPKKDSGIDWLGEIPEHWGVEKLKFLVNNVIETSTRLGKNEVYIGLENVESWSGEISLPKNNYEFESQAKSFKEDDVLLGKLRPYLAKVSHIENLKGACSGEFLVLRRKNPAILTKFLKYKLISYKLIHLINSSTYGAKMPRTNWDFVGNVELSLPPGEEQKNIVNYIEKVSDQTEKLIKKISSQIDKMKEYRQSLISEAVTGKIDCREYMPEQTANADV